VTTRSFDKAPSTAPMMLKAVLPALPVIGGLPGIKHAAKDVPDLVLERSGVAVDPAHLARYDTVCELPQADTLPATYPHMSAFPLHMALMTDTAFPFAPMGLVHLRNRITQHRPIGVGETFDVSVRAADLRPHPKGRLVDLLTTVTIGGEVVWEEITTLFSRGRDGAQETSPAPLEGVEAPSGGAQWRLKGDLGRRYGAVSGDRNPIHLHPLTAKAFGFPRNIAHGMWTKAHVLAAVQNRLPKAFTIDVEFKKPILLPGTVTFGSRTDGGVTTVGVTSGSTTHLVGRVSPIA
jgi:acyl dehydratase